jgi:hypothetical protein
VNLVPPAQWLPSHVFFTGPTYPTTNLVLVRETTECGAQDVTIDCIGKVTGWQPVDPGGRFEITNVDLIRVQPNGTCSNGGRWQCGNAQFRCGSAFAEMRPKALRR